MNQSEVDYHDVQGLVRFGYGKMKGAAYALLRVRDAAAARAWLRNAAITSAATMKPPPSTALQVAFTAMGSAHSVPAAVIDGFSPEFLTGMAEPNRARRLGDIGSNAPGEWEWGYGGDVPDLLVMFFADRRRSMPLFKARRGTTGTRHSKNCAGKAPRISTESNLSVLSTASASQRSTGNESAT